MADDTYMPLVYMVQGGDELVVASSGVATIESGGGVDVEFGGKVMFAVNGATSSDHNGSSALSTQSDGGGVTFIKGGSQGGDYKITIGPPYAGAEKLIFNTTMSTAERVIVSVGSGVGIITTGGDSTSHLMTVEATTDEGSAGWCHLTGLSTSRWIRTSYSPTSSWTIASTSS